MTMQIWILVVILCGLITPQISPIIMPHIESMASIPDCSASNPIHPTIEKNACFNSWDECKAALNAYYNDSKQYFVVDDSKKLSSHPIPEANEACDYQYVRLNCKYGPMTHELQETNERETRTFKCDCKAFIYIKLTVDGKKLYIKRLNLNHNGHDGSEEFFKFLPENRRLYSQSDRQEVKDLLALGCPKGKIRDRVREKKGVIMSAKDLHNIEQKERQQKRKPKDGSPEDPLWKFIQSLKDHGATVHVVYEEDANTNNCNARKVLRVLYFSTKVMRETFRAYPDMIFIDGTYLVFYENFILYFIVVRDPSGFTHIVAVGILANEQADTLRAFMEIFKREHPEAWQKVIRVMTDKDMTERRSILDVLPHVKLLLCEFHVLKAFAKKVTSARMKISPEERHNALYLFNRMVKSQSSEQFDYHHAEFVKKVPQSVLEYYNNNWHNCKEQWVQYAISDCNFGDKTNNPVEAVNAVVKFELKKKCDFLEFGDKFFAYYERRNLTVKQMIGETRYKRPTHGQPLGSVENWLENCLEPRAAKLVIDQYHRRSPIDFHEVNKDVKQCLVRQGYAMLYTSIQECDCNFFRSYNLACCHIFAVREYFEYIPLVEESMFHRRWTKEYTSENHPLVDERVQSGNHTNTPVTFTRVERQKPSTPSQRSKIMSELTSELFTLGCSKRGQDFEQRCEILRAVVDAWRSDNEVEIVLNNKENESHPDTSDQGFITPTPIRVLGRPRGIRCNRSKSRQNKRSTST